MSCKNGNRGTPRPLSLRWHRRHRRFRRLHVGVGNQRPVPRGGGESHVVQAGWVNTWVVKMMLYFSFFRLPWLGLQSVVCCLFLLSFPRLGEFFFYQSVFGSASASTSIGGIGSSLTWKLRLRSSGGGTPFWWWCVFWKVGCRIWRVSVEREYVYEYMNVCMSVCLSTNIHSMT